MLNNEKEIINSMGSFLSIPLKIACCVLLPFTLASTIGIIASQVYLSGGYKIGLAVLSSIILGFTLTGLITLLCMWGMAKGTVRVAGDVVGQVSKFTKENDYDHAQFR